jgi:hypothetical protein
MRARRVFGCRPKRLAGLPCGKRKGGGGNTSLSQAMVPAAGTRFQKEAGIEDSVELMTGISFTRMPMEAIPS